jgi:hypothetical protein
VGLLTAGVAGGGPTAAVDASQRLAAMAATSQDMVGYSEAIGLGCLHLVSPGKGSPTEAGAGAAAAMQGIELSRRFYDEVVGPWLARDFAGLGHAAALLGYGSELLGFDDAMSQDHNWGPRVWLYLTEADFAAHADAIVAAFADAAPERFGDVPVGWFNRPHLSGNGPHWRSDARHGLEVRTLEGAVRDVLGVELGQPLTNRAWLGLADQWLLELTGGAVFHDDDGRLTGLRERLAWLPRDVWLYKLASQWRRIAEEQAFVGRTGMVGDALGSRVIAARLVRDVMRMAFLVERRYAPYPKWFGSGFARLPCAAELSSILERVLDADAWHPREEALAEAYAAVGRLQQARGVPGAIAPRIGPYFGRPFTVINAEEIMAALRAEIEDEALKALPVIGSLDQVSDSTAVIEAPERARAAMAALLDDGEAGALEEA